MVIRLFTLFTPFRSPGCGVSCTRSRGPKDTPVHDTPLYYFPRTFSTWPIFFWTFPALFSSLPSVSSLGFILIRIISRIVDRIFYESPARARKERQHAPQVSAGYCFPYLPCLPSAKRSGGEKRKLRWNDRTSPPRLRRSMWLRIASNMTFLPGPWNSWSF